MKLRKILCLVLAAVMLLSVLAACNNDKPVETKPKETQGTSKPTETKSAETEPAKVEYTFPLAEPLTVTVDALLAKAEYPLSENIAWKYIQELSGFVFETTEIVAGEFKEKENLRMNSGEYGEMLFKCNTIDINQYGMDGIILPIEDIIKEYMPNLCKILDERKAWDVITAPDGHIYAIPNVQMTGAKFNNGTNIWINQEWLTKLNLKMPTSPEELYTVLKAFKEQDPNGNGQADEIPLIDYGGGTLLHNLMGFFDYGLYYGSNWMVIDGEMKYVPMTEEGKEIISWMKKFYDEGLINSDFVTVDNETIQAIGKASDEGVVGMFLASSVSNFVSNEAKQNADHWVSFKPANPELFPLDNGVRHGGLALTDKCKNPEVILAFFDYLYTQEGGLIIRSGVENVSYRFTEEGYLESINEGFQANVYQATFMGAANVPGIIPDAFYFQSANATTRYINDEQFREGYGCHVVGVPVPSVSRTTEETEEFTIINTDVSTAVKAYYAEAITGVVDLESTWADFQASLKAMGVERMIEIQNAAYQRAVEKQAAAAG